MRGRRSVELAVAVAGLAATGCDSPPDAIGPAGQCAARGPALAGLIERAAEIGLAFDYVPTDYRGGALAVADLDGDGRLDVVAGSRAGGLAGFMNLGALRFTPADPGLGLAIAEGVHFVAPADLDGDGDLDLAIATDLGLAILARDGDGFVRRAPIDERGAIEHVLPIDLDGDRRLDLVAVGRGFRADGDGGVRVYLGDGALGFARLATAELAGVGMGWTASAFDLDGDGDLELHVANDTFQADHGDGEPVPSSDLPVDALYQNRLIEDGALGFRDRAAALGLDTPRSSMGGLWAELDGEPGVELLVTDFGSKKVFVGDAGGLVDRAGPLGLAAPRRADGACAEAPDDDACLLLSWGVQVGDLDLDGEDDVVVADGAAVPNGAAPPQLVFRGPPPYREVDAGLGCFEGHGLIAADLDDDGDLELLVSTRAGPLRVFENRAAPAGGALAIELRGADGNLAGLGATVEVTRSDGRRIVRTVGAGGVVHSAPPARVHVGLGDAAAVRVRVRWPSGAVQDVVEPGPTARLTIREE